MIKTLISFLNHFEKAETNTSKQIHEGSLFQYIEALRNLFSSLKEWFFVYCMHVWSNDINICIDLDVE